MKKTFAVLLSGIMCISAIASQTFTAGAEEESPYRKRVEVEYFPNEDSLSTNNDGVSVRKNILNMWGNSQYYHNVEDIDQLTVMIDHIKVDFTVSGIGEDSELVKEDGTTEPYYAWLCGSVGTNSGWNVGDEGIPYVEIKGDGDYSLIWDLDLDADGVECLILQTNINYFRYLENEEEGNQVLDSSVRLDITSISTLEQGWTLYGDANLDGNVSLADTVAVLQYLANPNKYYLTSGARESADVYNNGDGISGQDALMIQQYDAGVIDNLVPPDDNAETEQPVETTTTVVYEDSVDILSTTTTVQLVSEDIITIPADV